MWRFQLLVHVYSYFYSMNKGHEPLTLMDWNNLKYLETKENKYLRRMGEMSKWGFKIVVIMLKLNP